MYYSVSWSGGKDSTASIILAHIHGEPVDSIVFAEVMFDMANGISGENPQHIEFIKNKAIPKFESWGYKVDVIHSDRDFLSVFNRVIERPRKNMAHKGLKYGFPPNGLCSVKRDCKLRAIKSYYKNIHEENIQYIGIASDETKRLNSLHKTNNISLLEKYGVTESEAMQLCKEYDLLSPIYELSQRGGCWFCPNAKLSEHRDIKARWPDVWRQYVDLEDEKVAFAKWNTFSDVTLHDIDNILSKEDSSRFGEGKV